MYTYLTQLQATSSGGSSMTSALSQLVASNLFRGSGSGSGYYVNCLYSSDPTSANLLCYLYCMIQSYYGLQCSNAPTSLSWLPATTTAGSTTVTPMCPYISDLKASIACPMYYYLTNLQQASSGGSSALLSALMAEALFRGSGSGSTNYVNCIYSNDTTSANLLCYLYCNIQPYFGIQCSNGSAYLMWSGLSSTTFGSSGIMNMESSKGYRIFLCCLVNICTLRQFYTSL
jgi:hypothetical protein